MDNTEKHNKCIHLSELVRTELIAIRDAIKENKYYLSESAGRDIGEEQAQKDFWKNHIEKWGEDFKRKYCADCPDKKSCLVFERLYQAQQSDK